MILNTRLVRMRDYVFVHNKGVLQFFLKITVRKGPKMKIKIREKSVDANNTTL